MKETNFVNNTIFGYGVYTNVMCYMKADDKTKNFENPIKRYEITLFYFGKLLYLFNYQYRHRCFMIIFILTDFNRIECRINSKKKHSRKISKL